jgi:hypothetical protein
MTLIPQGFVVQEIICYSRQSILRTQGALSRLKQTGRQLNQPLDFSNHQEDPLGTVLPDHTSVDTNTDPFEALI